MSNALDPRELKVLADILALVLEEHPGSSSNALDALRKRAQRNAITGGALKNLFIAIAPEPPARTRARARADSAGSDSGMSTAARAQITTLTNDLRRLDRDLRTARAQGESLRAELDQTRMARATLQSQLSAMRNRAPLRNSLVAIAFVVGTLVGIASTQFVHRLELPPQTDNLPYLHP
jgi:hypothetical protein